MMKDYTRDSHSTWIIWGSIVAVLLLGVGIFFYYTFLRQSKSELIETVPTDAAFIFEINDNDAFVKNAHSVLPYLNELFAMDALPAYESVYNVLADNRYDITISGHSDGTAMYLLFNTRTDEHAFKRLLKALNIDPKNYTPYEEHKIYSYGTNYKSLKIVYYNHIISISENVELLKKALIQHKHPKNLLSITSFKDIYNIVEKNKKQNWLIFQNQIYTNFLNSSIGERHLDKINKLKGLSDWSAYQISFTNMEIHMSGYITTESDIFNKLRHQTPKLAVPHDVLPFNSDWYYKIEIPDHESLYNYYKTTSTRQGLTALDLQQFQRMAPLSACYFAITGDSSRQYHYLAILQDSLKSTFAKIFGDNQTAEEIATHYPNGIYPAPEGNFNRLISQFDHNTFQFFTLKNGYYVFAESKKAMDCYTGETSHNGYLSENPLFKFSNDNLATSNLLEFTFFNNTKNKPLLKYLSEKGKNSQTAQDLMIFSISCNELAGKFANTNIYFHFGKPTTETQDNQAMQY